MSCVCKELFASENNIEEKELFLCDDGDGVIYINFKGKRIYDYCKCDEIDKNPDLKKKAQQLELKRKIEIFSMNPAYPYLLKLITKLNLNIEDVI